MVIAAYILVVVQVTVSLFQLALALGAPMGEYALGGKNVGRLPKKLRIVAGVNLIANLAIAGHYLAQTGLLPTLLAADLNSFANWGLVGFFSLGLIMNSISTSKKERNLWVPVLLLSVSCSIIVALG